ncbi:MAG: phosphotransferase [Armatimonadetes bacterium]|nr:phosphotransferase [Armatimonadota bacterium]
MTDDAADRTITYAVLIADRDGRRILLQRDGEGWSLPRWQTRGERSWAEVDEVTRTVQARLGLEATILRRVPPDPATVERIRTYELEHHGPGGQIPVAARWVGSEDLDGLAVTLPGDRALVAGWFERQPGGTPPRRVPWARPGWFQTAVAWILTQLEALGLRPTGPVQQARAWTISTILRVATSAGTLYFKASADIFATEPLITRYVARRFPGHTPEVLAVDEQRSWMLMRDVGGTRLAAVPEIGPWEDALRVLAWMQLGCVERTDELLASGFADRRLERLATQVDPLLAYAVSTPTSWRDALTTAERDALSRMAPRLKDLCAGLAGYGLPETLEHGDSHAGNIVSAGDRSIVFDWSDAGVAHPFFSLLPFFMFRRLPEHPDARDRLLRVYLEPWTAYHPMDRLMAAYEASRPLAALHQATAYWRILTGVEDEARWEWEADLPYFLRLLLPPAQERAPT